MKIYTKNTPLAVYETEGVIHFSEDVGFGTEEEMENPAYYILFTDKQGAHQLIHVSDIIKIEQQYTIINLKTGL